jgi:hypothetical protein
LIGATGAVPGWSRIDDDPSRTDVDWPKPAASPSLSALNFFWSTVLIAKSTMNSTMSRVIMSA